MLLLWQWAWPSHWYSPSRRAPGSGADPNLTFIGPMHVGRTRKPLAGDIVYECNNGGNSIGYNWFNPHARTTWVADSGVRFVPLSPDVGEMNLAYTDGSVQRLEYPAMRQMYQWYLWFYGDGKYTQPDPH